MVAEEYGVSLEGDEKSVLKLFAVIVAQLCDCTKKLIQFKCINVMVCEFHPNKAVPNKKGKCISTTDPTLI